MKIVPNRTLSAFVAVFSGVSAFAGPGNQAPPQPGFIPPPGLPIDDSIVILIAAAVIYGLYKVYKSKLNGKSPA